MLPQVVLHNFGIEFNQLFTGDVFSKLRQRNRVLADVFLTLSIFFQKKINFSISTRNLGIRRELEEKKYDNFFHLTENTQTNLFLFFFNIQTFIENRGGSCSTKSAQNSSEMIYTKFRKNLIFFFFENLKNHERINSILFKLFRIFLLWPKNFYGSNYQYKFKKK